jgi:hypothetical protein
MAQTKKKAPTQFNAMRVNAMVVLFTAFSIAFFLLAVYKAGL